MNDTDRDILDFERTWWRYKGAKEAEILTRFGLSGTRYYQTLHRIIHDPEALKYDAMLVKRLLRIEARQLRARSARRVGL